MASPPQTIPRDCITCDGGCGQTAPAKRCSKCQTVYYCSASCQKKSWPEHKNDCRSVDGVRNSLMGLGEGARLLSDSDMTGINSECAICLETEMQNPIVLEECRHAFCSSCLLRWQDRKRAGAFSPTNPQGTQNHACPLCRSETVNQVDRLLDSAMLSAERANRPGIPQQEKATFRAQALATIEQAMDTETPHLQAFWTKIEILIALGDGAAALECIDELVKTNEERWEKRRPLEEMMEQADAALARGDENADHLMETAIQMVQEAGLPAEALKNDKETHFAIELKRAEAYALLEDWEAAKNVYQLILQSMEGPQDGTPPQQRQVFMGLSRCGYELGAYDRSIYATEAALDMNRHFPGVHKYKALSEKASGDIDAAIRTMNRAVLYETPWDERNKAEVLELYNELLEEKAS